MTIIFVLQRFQSDEIIPSNDFPVVHGTLRIEQKNVVIEVRLALVDVGLRGRFLPVLEALEHVLFFRLFKQIWL